jgi:hypothetical protein
MKKALLPVLLLSLNSMIATAQTTATDFTATDCGAVSHNLFTELNAGKVVVLVWVMPCGACISDAKAGYDAAQSFATSNPGQVLYWLADDMGNTSCSSLSSWAGTNAIGPTGVTMFGNAGNTISEANYGGSGMPHVVVIGGASHHIYYNMLNGSSDGPAITSAIVSALSPAAISSVSSNRNEVKLYPNPSKDRVSVSYDLNEAAPVSVEIMNVIGVKVKALNAGTQPAGQHSLDINFENDLPRGIYVLKLTTGNTSRTVKFNITN